MAIVNYLIAYVLLLGSLILLAINGIAIFFAIFRPRSITLLVGGGMATGPLGLLFFLGILSYVLRGHWGITIIFTAYTALAGLLIWKNRRLLRELVGPPQLSKLSWQTWLYPLLVVTYVSLLFAYTRGAPVGGDVTTHWSIAASFARGNYPSVLPWQPQYLTAYHQGGFMVLGALHSLAGTNISITFFFYAFYIVAALFIFVTGIARQHLRSALAIVPAVMGVVLFGGPILYTGNVLELAKELVSSRLTGMSQFWDFKGGAGTGASSLGFLYYHAHYTLGLVALFLFLYLLIEVRAPVAKLLNKYLVAIALLVLTLSVMESIFPLGLIPLITFYLYENKKTPIRVFLANSLILAAVSLGLSFTIQNLVRDTVFQHLSGPGITLIQPFGSEFMSRVSYFASKELVFDGGLIKWYIPDLRLLVGFALIVAALLRSKWAFWLAIMAAAGIVLGLVVVDPYYRSSALRFINASYQLVMFAFGFLLIDLARRGTRLSWGVFGILILLILPHTVAGSAVFMSRAIYRDDDNLIRFIDYKNETLDWVNQNIAYDKKIIFVDEYPFQGLTSSLTSKAVLLYGFFVPQGPLKAKLISVDGAGEWFDAIAFLDPGSLRSLGVEYVFIMNSEVHRFSTKRREEIANRKFFEPTYRNSSGVLYRVLPEYKSLADDELTVMRLEAMIPDRKAVFLDKLPEPVHAARRGLLVNLSHRTKLIGPVWTAGAGAQFLYIADLLPIMETDTPGKEIKDLRTLNVDYAITSPEKNPNTFLKGKFQLKGKNQYVALWENSL